LVPLANVIDLTITIENERIWQDGASTSNSMMACISHQITLVRVKDRPSYIRWIGFRCCKKVTIYIGVVFFSSPDLTSLFFLKDLILNLHR
jgi:hypothetical protein